MFEKKAGILTFHGADNLGAVLQAYALTAVIRNECGIDAQIIDYECKKINATRYIQKGNGIKLFIRNIPMSAYYRLKRKGFEKFRNEHLKITSQKYTKDKIANTEKEFDYFVTGSDQVWNPECSDCDSTYVLDFVSDNRKKLSYAASIGNYNFSETDGDWLKNISEYSKISLREKSAQKQLSSIGINNCCVHPDPVFLLKKEEWQRIMCHRLEKRKYILVYLVLPDVNVMRAATIYAEKNNCKIISNKKSIEFILHNSPSEFISWINYADCVFTNSFHGTAFSLLFGKNLYSDVIMSDGKINNRVYDLLADSDCLNCSEIKDSYDISNPKLDLYFEKVRKDAIDYLKEIFI